MNLASASNLGNGFISNVGGGAESIIVGIVTGIISSMIVTQIYRYKDSERVRAEFLSELFSFSAKTILFLVSWMYSSGHSAMFRQAYDLESICPSRFSWIKFNKKENEIIERIINESKKTLSDIVEIELLREECKSATATLSDKQKRSKKIDDINKRLLVREMELMKGQEELKELLKKYTE